MVGPLAESADCRLGLGGVGFFTIVSTPPMFTTDMSGASGLIAIGLAPIKSNSLRSRGVLVLTSWLWLTVRSSTFGPRKLWCNLLIAPQGLMGPLAVQAGLI